MSCIVAHLQNCTLGSFSNGKVNRCLLLYNKNNKENKRLKSTKTSSHIYWQIVPDGSEGAQCLYLHVHILKKKIHLLHFTPDYSTDVA
jgi:ribosomal protein L18